MSYNLKTPSINTMLSLTVSILSSTDSNQESHLGARKYTAQWQLSLIPSKKKGGKGSGREGRLVSKMY